MTQSAFAPLLPLPLNPQKEGGVQLHLTLAKWGYARLKALCKQEAPP